MSGDLLRARISLPLGTTMERRRFRSFSMPWVSPVLPLHQFLLAQRSGHPQEMSEVAAPSLGRLWSVSPERAGPAPSGAVRGPEEVDEFLAVPSRGGAGAAGETGLGPIEGCGPQLLACLERHQHLREEWEAAPVTLRPPPPATTFPPS